MQTELLLFVQTQTCLLTGVMSHMLSVTVQQDHHLMETCFLFPKYFSQVRGRPDG